MVHTGYVEKLDIYGTCNISVLFPFVFQNFLFRWLNFEKVVHRLVADKIYYLSIEQLQTIIQRACFIDNENEVVTMLDFYHDLGMIVKHHSTVVLRAQWLIDLFKQLITLRSFNDMVRNKKLNAYTSLT